MTTVLTYGTFDLFHVGHVELLKRAHALGDRLIVGVSSDEFNALKGKRSVMSYADRAAIVGAIKYVSEVLPEHDWAQKEQDIRKYGVDVLVMGDDWVGKFDHLSGLCKVEYLPRTEGISTTELKQALKPFRDDKLEDLQNGLRALQDLVNQLEI